MSTASTPEWTQASEPLQFAAGLPGFEEHKIFVLESREDLRPFLWLRSTVDSEVALPVISSFLLKTSVLPLLSKEHLKLIGDPAMEHVAPYYILRVEADKNSITVNTKAPLIIRTDTGQGHQVILDNDELQFDAPLAALLPSTGGDPS
ncbi:MAG: flagellar assembly protein FliW [Candidatus Neomarinimicrobiota bacterium]